MSVELPRPAPEREHLVSRRRFNAIKYALAALLLFLLMAASYKGKQHARIQVRRDAIILARDQLQQKLDDADITRLPSTNRQFKTLVSSLDAKLGQFDSEVRPRD